LRENPKNEKGKGKKKWSKEIGGEKKREKLSQGREGFNYIYNPRTAIDYILLCDDYDCCCYCWNTIRYCLI